PGRPRSLLPKPRHHKASGRMLVEIDGHRSYFGKWGSSEAQAKYDKFLAEWMQAGRPRMDHVRVQPGQAFGPPTIAQVAVKYLAWRRKQYGDPPLAEGQHPVGETGNYFDALRP